MPLKVFPVQHNNNFVDLLKEKSVVSPFAEDPPISPLLTEETQQMNCSPEYVILIYIFSS